MKKNEKFLSFLESMKSHNPTLVEAITQGFNICFESESSDIYDKHYNDPNSMNYNPHSFAPYEQPSNDKWMHMSDDEAIKTILDNPLYMKNIWPLTRRVNIIKQYKNEIQAKILDMDDNILFYFLKRLGDDCDKYLNLLDLKNDPRLNEVYKYASTYPSPDRYFTDGMARYRDE